MLKQLSSSGLILAFALVSKVAFGATEITPFAGHRFAGNISLLASGAATTNELRFENGASAGILVNADVEGQGRQLQLYYSHQSARARPENPADFGGLAQFDVAIDRLQIGGLYFPGGESYGGFVDGTLGMTRLDPRASGKLSPDFVHVSAYVFVSCEPADESDKGNARGEENAASFLKAGSRSRLMFCATVLPDLSGESQTPGRCDPAGVGGEGRHFPVNRCRL